MEQHFSQKWFVLPSATDFMSVCSDTLQLSQVLTALTDTVHGDTITIVVTRRSVMRSVQLPTDWPHERSHSTIPPGAKTVTSSHYPHTPIELFWLVKFCLQKDVAVLEL